MDSFIYLLLEILIVGLIILGLYASKKYFGIGLLFIFLGTVQFFQTILSSSVYNLYFDYFIFSPGSALIFTSTLFAILLIYKSESVIKIRSVVYGVVLCNVILVFLSYISLEQILTDSYSKNTAFLQELFNFDINFFITGTLLLYIDMIFIMFLFGYLTTKFPRQYFVHFVVSSIVTSVFDSVLFFSLNFFEESNFYELLIGNMVGKVLVCIALSVLFAFYFFVNPPKERKAKKLKDIFIVMNFFNGKN